MTKTKKGICGLCYHSPGCGAIVHFDEEDKIVRLEPDPDVPMGQDLCPIADFAHEIIYSDRRLKTPLIRTGKKGKFEFEKISWDDAFDIIVERINHIKRDHGPKSIGFYAGTGSYEQSIKDVFQVGKSEIYLASSVLFPFGSPNSFGVGAPCYTSLGVIAPKTTVGSLHTEMYSDLDNSDLIIVWGTNPATSTPPTNFKRLKVALEEDAKVIVIDPRKTECANLDGSEWIPIRPGTDGALALGLCHVLLREGLYDQEFVEKWTLGFEDFSEYVREFTPSRVSQITNIPESRIETLAKEIYHAEGASYIMYTGLEYSKSGVQSIRAVMVLWAIAGQLDVLGGRGFLMKGNGIPIPKEKLIDNPGYDDSIAKDKFPVYAHYCKEPHASLIPKSILESEPYKIRSLIVQGASLATSWPDPYIWRKALNELEFLVCIDLQLTADCAYADIVLPATTGFEFESYCYYYCTARIREKMIEPIGESRPDYAILSELATRLGYGDLYPQNSEEVLKHFLSGSEITVEAWRKKEHGVIRNCHLMMEHKKWEKGLLRSDGKPGFETPSGKFEITSSILEKYGYDGLPTYRESDETPVSEPELAKKFPLILGTGSLKPDMKTCFRAIPSFMKKIPHPIIEINTEDADMRGLATGDVVVVKTVRGEVVMRAYVTDNIIEGVVYAAVGGGGPLGTEEWKRANVNVLTDLDQYDEISGFPVYKVLLCEVSKKRRVRKGAANQYGSLGCSG
jgi:anaerobic selenocysteine-containing dehydrogenase